MCRLPLALRAYRSAALWRQIFVDSQLQLSIRNPQRTKALLPALDLSTTLRLGIRAVAAGETFSALACADHRPGKLAAAA